MNPDRDSVIDIEVRRSESLRIEYADGVVAEFPVAALRAACPCATCRGIREQGGSVWPPAGSASTATVTIDTAELAGAWGLSIRWSDGHDTGIYAWSVLRKWWDAGHDGPLVIDPVPGA